MNFKPARPSTTHPNLMTPYVQFTSAKLLMKHQDWADALVIIGINRKAHGIAQYDTGKLMATARMLNQEAVLTTLLAIKRMMLTA